MKQSHLFLQTFRHKPKDSTSISHEYLVRGGYISQLSAGIWSLLPLGLKVLKKIEDIIREELTAIGAQEALLPAMQPKELWEESGRWDTFDPPLFQLVDRHKRTFTLGPTHEEVITDLARKYIQSYKQLPQALFQIQTKFRNEMRATGGLLRVREFQMKDLYSFHATTADLDEYYKKVKNAYANIYARCGLKAIAVEASSGSIGGSECHEFMALSDSGEDKVALCKTCHYAANREMAPVILSKIIKAEKEKKLEIINTGDASTIDEISKQLNIAKEKTIKAVFYVQNDQLVMAVIRGDREINEAKLKKVLGDDARMASTQEVIGAGLVPGQASPIQLKNKSVRIIGDNSIAAGHNLVAGANMAHKHYAHVNYPRDFSVEILTDIGFVEAADICPKCGGEFELLAAIEVGHIFKLGTVYSQKMNALFLDENGKKHALVMGCYGIGVGRLLATVVESSHDDKGIIWPAAIAPYSAHLIILGHEKSVIKNADLCYQKLIHKGIATLYDDRPDVSPGEKFNDSDLLGLPYRIVVSRKTGNMVEIQSRQDKKTEVVKLEKAIEKLNP